jgi:Protein of unknown function (DUF4232)
MSASVSRFTPILLAGLVVLLAACSASGSTSGSVTVASSSGGTSSASAPVTSSTSVSSPIPATSPAQASVTPTSTASSGTASAPSCATTQLTLRLGGGLVKGGDDIYYLYFVNSGGAACVLRGYPSVSAVTGPSGTGRQIGAAAQRAATSPAAAQLLQPGNSAEATLIFARTGNYVSALCRHAKVQFVRVVPPGDTTALYEGEIYDQVCAETTLPTMTITTVKPDSSVEGTE